MRGRFESYEDLPGQARIVERPGSVFAIAAALAGAAWPPLILTLPIWPPSSWMPGWELDWRLMVLIIGLIAVPLGVWRVQVERRRKGRPGSRLGVVWRFMLFGGLLAAALQVVMALALTALGAAASGNAMQALGAAETTLLIFGVGALPLSIIVGISYGLWAGLCAAFIAFEVKPAVKDRLGLMPKT
nr:phthalate transporter [uncultured Brevundimonas sp.]